MMSHARQIGSTITNGEAVLRLTWRGRDWAYRGPGWRGIAIPLEPHRSKPVVTGFMPDYLLTAWYHVPFEWRMVPGSELEERYAWSRDQCWLIREVRKFPAHQGLGSKERS